jgi:hypothetical protein
MKLLCVLLVACAHPSPPREPMPLVGHYCLRTCAPGPLVAPFLAELAAASITPMLADCCKEAP